MTCSTRFKKHALLFVAAALFITFWMSWVVPPTSALAQANPLRARKSAPSQGVSSPRSTKEPLAGSSPSRQSATVDVSARKRVADAYGKLPVTFEANQGQFDPQVKFLAHGGGYNVFLTATEAVLAMRSSQPIKKDKRTGKKDD